MKHFYVPIEELEKIRAQAQEDLKREVENWKKVAASHQQCARMFATEIKRLTNKYES